MKIEEFKQAQLLINLIKVRYPKYPPFWFVFYMYVLYLQTIKRNRKYIVKSVSLEDIIKIVDDKSFVNDINNTVMVHVHNIYKNDIILNLYCDKRAICRSVYPVPIEGCDKNEILVSDTFYHNLLKHNLIDSVRLLNNVNQIKFAEEISVSKISSQHEIGNGIVDTLLEKYFLKPKLVHKDDIIEIDLNYFAEDLKLLKNDLHYVQSIFFKCNNIIYNGIDVDGCYYCVIGETAIRQSVDKQNFLPKRDTKLIREDGNLKKLPICPYGLQEHFDEIELAAKTFLRKSKLDLQPIFLLVGNSGCGDEIILSSLAGHLGMHHYKIDNYKLMANVYSQNETKLHNAFFNAKAAAPCIISIHNFENFGMNNEGQYDERLMGHFSLELKFLFENNPYPILLFCCSNKKEINVHLKQVFLQTFEINSPTDIQRHLNLKWICEKKSKKTEVDFHDISNKTHGFFFEDLEALVYYAERNALKHSDSCKNISAEDFTEAIDYMQRNYNESIGAPKIPKVLWSDVGGLTDVKEEINKTINLPLKHPEIFKKSGLKRSGILLFGPPGTGKTLIAKAVATECNLCFLSVKGPELLNMYVGQSEQNIREVFKKAREASPCIIFFDELDSLAPNRGKSGDSNGVMDRVVSQLLAEMDGLNDSATVFIIGATNRPDLIDPALLRPGRFDKLLYIGPCTDKNSKLSVLKALTRKFKLSDGVDLAEVVNVCPKNITGADFYGICSSAWLFAVRKLIKRIEIGEVSADSTTSEDVVVDFDDFKKAMMDIKPSISQKDLVYFEKLKLELGSNI